MDRSRRAGARRQGFTFGGHGNGNGNNGWPAATSALTTSPKSDSAASLPLPGPQSPVSPIMAHALTTNNTPQQTAFTSFQGRRSNSNTSMHDFSFSSPLQGSNTLSRKRSRTLDDSYDTPAPEDENDEDNKKGGHSLRKRVRVNYASELIDDEVVVPNSSSSISRARNRRSEGSEDAQEFTHVSHKRRATTDLSDSPSARRRNPSRKSLDFKPFTNYFNEDSLDHSQSFSHNHDDTATNQSQPDMAASDFAAGPPNSSPSMKAIKTSQEPETVVPYATQDDYDRGSNNEGYDMPDSYGLEASDGPYPYHNFADDPNYQLQEENYESVQAASSRGPSQDQEIPVDPLLAASMSEQSATSRASSESVQKPLAVSREESSETAKTNPDPVPDDKFAETAHDDQPSTLTEDASADASIDHPEKVNIVQEDEQSPDDKRSENEPSGAPVAPTATQDENTADQEETAPSQAETAVAEDEPSPAQDEANMVQNETAPAHDETTRDQDESTPQNSSLVPVQSIENQEDAPNEVTTFPRNAPPANRPTVPRITSFKKPFPAPQGRYAHLTPYIEGEYTYYPEHLVRAAEEEAAMNEEQNSAEKDYEGEGGEADLAIDDGADTVTGTEDPTPALNTPLPGSPNPESTEPTAYNSPTATGEDGEDVETSDRQESPAGHVRYKFRKIREEDEYLALLENYEQLTTDELYEVCQALNVSLSAWEGEYARCGKAVDDYENAERRRVADAKYEAKTADLSADINFEEPEFQVKGYKARAAEKFTDNRWLQAQDRLMSQFYGFEYDPHPSKIGKQNPFTQRGEGKETRSRSLRNQPKQTAKATEADEVTGKRLRKPVQLYEPPSEPASRASTPVPTRSRRGRKAANAEPEPPQPPSFTSVEAENETNAQGRPQRKRPSRAKQNAPSIADDMVPTPDILTSSQEEPKPVGRRGRAAKAAPAPAPVADEPRVEQPRKRHILTLKIPKSKDLSQPPSAISDNGESRPSTAASDATSQTVESNYSFRPNRQKRFRDEPDAVNGDGQERPKKKAKHAEPSGENGDIVMSITPTTESGMPNMLQPQNQPAGERKPTKIRITKPIVAPPQDSRNGTPTSQPSIEDGEKPKDYSTMTKSEKMSASMKSKFFAILDRCYVHC